VQATGSFSIFAVFSTPYLDSTERTIPPCLTLTRFLSDEPREYIFGKTAVVDVRTATAKNAAKVANERKIPALSVYVLVPTATSDDGIEMIEQQEADICYLFRDVPARLLRLKSQHFFATESPQPLLSSDRAAALYAAMKLHEAPVLLLDAGVSITYMALDRNAKVMGGGVGPGLKMRFSALADYQGVESYPDIDYEQFVKTLDDAAQKKTHPIPLFAPDAVTAMIGAAVSEIAGNLRRVVKCFLENTKPPTGDGSPENDQRSPVTVAITGNDLPFIQNIFQANCSNIVTPEPGTTFPSKEQIKIVAEKNLMPMGVATLLHNNLQETPTLNETEKMRELVVGLRGAKAESYVVKFESTPGIYRGTFIRFIRGKSVEEDLYEIVFDNDGEKELLNHVEFYDALALYGEVGETSEEDTRLCSTDEKRKTSQQVQDTLVKTSSKVSARKEVLDAMKESEGSIASILGIPTVKRGKKRNRNPKVFNGDPTEFINQRVAKWFEDELYFGTIESISNQGDGVETWWHVLYDDDDQEDFDIRQLRKALKDYEENKSSDPKKKVNTATDRDAMDTA
jgi:hypothetical protein